MALQAMVKNIYTYANILSQAGTDAVQNWNDKSLQNALNWAAYCMKVAEKTQNSVFKNDLDFQVQCFTVLMKPPSLLCLTLDSLCHAQETMCKRLLQNPYSPDGIVKKVVELQLKNMSSTCIKEKDRTCSRKNIGNNSQPCLHLLVGEDPDFDLAPLKTRSSFILERLLHLSNLSLVSINRMNNFLELIVMKIADCENGLDILAEMLLLDVGCIELHTDIENLKDKILKVVIQMSGNHSGIWTIDTKRLCELSNRDDQFLEHHVHHILAWLNNMEPVYGLTEQGELYTWRYSMETSDTTLDRTSYRKLVEHISSCVAYNRRLRTKIVPLLENLANKSYFNICKDFLKCL